MTDSITPVVKKTRTKKLNALTSGINFRLSPDDLAQLELAVARTGQKNRTRVVRDLIHGIKIYERTPVIDIELLTEIRAIGNNLNQSTKVLNTKLLEKSVSPEALFGIKTSVKALEELMKTVVKNMMAGQQGGST